MDTNISVLIVEDDIQIRFLLEIIFEEFKIPTTSVGSLRRAKEELEISIPTLIFLDNSLPDGKGIDFIGHLKNNYPCIKILMCTAENLGTEVSGKELYRYIQKPFSIETLKNIIREIIALPGCYKDRKCFSQKCSLSDTLV